MKLNLGCGGNVVDGWENHDIDVDITKPLPYRDASVSVVFAEHLIEHVNHRDGYLFLKECYRVLCDGGVVRISVPCVDKIALCINSEYCDFAGNGNQVSAIESIIINHGHQSVWTKEIGIFILTIIGFKDVKSMEYCESANGLYSVDGHWKVIGREFNWIETYAFEGVK